MSLGKIPSLIEVIGRRRSVEASMREPHRPQGDQDYVLVEDNGQDGKPDEEKKDDCLKVEKSPAAAPIGLKALSDQGSDEGNSEFGVPMSPTTLDAIRQRFTSEEVSPLPQSLELNFDHMPEIVNKGDEKLQQALDEANQQHQWAMQAVIRGWEAEKKDLLSKLEMVIEARDTLEVELKHREHSFAGMLEGILDQKLDHMMQVLHESGSLSRSSTFSPSFNANNSFLDANQVADDLGVMLERMREQQAAIEDKVGTMQSAVLQLAPATAGDSHNATPSAPVMEQDAKRSPPFSFIQTKLRPPLAAAANSIGGKVSYLRRKVPQLSVAASQKTGSTFRRSAFCVKFHVVRAAHFCRQNAPQKKHLQAAGFLIAGGVIATVLKSSRPVRAIQEPQPMPAVEAEERELHVLEDEHDAASILDQSVEIILNRNGVFKRIGRGPDSTAMVLAWPRISVEYN